MIIGQRWEFYDTNNNHVIAKAISPYYCKVLQRLKGDWKVGATIGGPYCDEKVVNSNDQYDRTLFSKLWIYLEGQDK
jgi:hypothetical protein